MNSNSYKIPKDTLDQVFAAAKIEEVVGDYVTLKKRGANMIGLCPFHTEKTGSFTVSPSKGIYKCFGCGKAGNAIGFVMEVESCGFAEAVRQVAKKYHIEVEERQMTQEEQQRYDDRESMFIVNDFACKWFQDQLHDTEEGQAIGMSYFRERGLTEKTIRDFQLGYSPEKGNKLSVALKQRGFTEKYMVNDTATLIGTGVCGQSDDGRLYDRFRDRVIFPIHTRSGKVVGFAGRILRKKYDKDGNELSVGKYVNSPDSIIYSKSNQMYGIYQAKQAISRADRCYLVEGQMDVISMHQSGIENVVCSGGTALTAEHVQIIKRFTSNVTIIYDGDAAGIHAAQRAIDMFIEEGCDVKLLLLPNNEDPDSFARTHDAAEFIDYINRNQVDFVRYQLQVCGEQVHHDPDAWGKLISAIVNTISLIPELIKRQVYIKTAASLLAMPEEVLIRKVAQQRREKYRAKKREDERHEQSDSQEAVSSHVAEQKVVSAAAPTTNTVLRARYEQNYSNLIQMIIRYGERIITPQEGVQCSVGQYIIEKLQEDEADVPNPTMQRIIQEFLQHQSDDNFVAADFFKFHQDVAISTMAAEMISDKYQLSAIYSKTSVSENVTQVVNTNTPMDAGRLSSMVVQMVCEIKLTIIDMRIEQQYELIRQTEQSHDMELQMQHVALQQTLFNFKRQLCEMLGHRTMN